VIDITFDFRSDTPPGRDPDAASPTLRRYHQLLWSKQLPSGAPFTLDVTTPRVYLHHRSELGEFFLASDAVVPFFSRARKLVHITGQIPRATLDEYNRVGYTIGGMMVFPGNQVGRKMSINQARGCHPLIKDRFDLTLECIRRHYVGEPSPLSDTLARYADFFDLFGDFAGYVDFFHLQDLVDEPTAPIECFMPFDGFATSPLPGTLEVYSAYCERAMDFLGSRNRRIATYVAQHPPEAPTQPVSGSDRFEAVFGLAEAVGQRDVLEELLAVGDRLGLYARPYVGSVMFTPPTNRTRMLFTVSPYAGGMHMWVSADAFAQFFSQISADEARRELGPDGEREIDQSGTREFIASLERLLQRQPP
jgi:hypothetical protein